MVVLHISIGFIGMTIEADLVVSRAKKQFVKEFMNLKAVLKKSHSFSYFKESISKISKSYFKFFMKLSYFRFNFIFNNKKEYHL